MSESAPEMPPPEAAAPGPGLGGPAVAQGEPIPAEGMAMSEEDIARAERDAFLHELCYFLCALADLANEGLAFAGLLAFGTCVATATLAIISSIALSTFGAAFHACVVIHPLVMVAQLPSLCLSVLAGSSQMRAYYRLDATATWLLRLCLFVWEFLFLFAIVAPHSAMIDKPQLAMPHCGIDAVLHNNPVPLQNLATATFAAARAVVLGMLWVIAVSEGLAKAIHEPQSFPWRICAYSAGVVGSMMHVVKGAAYMSDVLVFIVAALDEVALRCLLLLTNTFREVGHRKPYVGSTFGERTWLTRHESLLRVAIRHPDAGLILSIVAAVLGILYGALYQQQKHVRRQRYLRATTVAGTRAN